MIIVPFDQILTQVSRRECQCMSSLHSSRKRHRGTAFSASSPHKLLDVERTSTRQVHRGLLRWDCIVTAAIQLPSNKIQRRKDVSVCYICFDVKCASMLFERGCMSPVLYNYHLSCNESTTYIPFVTST